MGTALHRGARRWRPQRSDRLRQPDAVAVRVVARLRVVLAIALGATGSFLPNLSGRHATLFVVIALGWVPCASAVLFAADTPGHALAVYGGPLADVAVLSVMQRTVAGSGTATLLGYVVLVAFATYTGGKTFGGLLGAGAMAFTLVSSHSLSAGDAIHDTTVGLYSIVLVGIIFLLDRTATVQSRTAALSARSQGKSDAILARVADAVVVTTATGDVLEWSPAAERILGRDREDAIGHPCEEALGLHIGERAVDCSKGCPLLALDTGGDDLLGHEVWRTHPNGTGQRQPLLANAAAVANPDGSPAEVVHSLRDVTRLKQAEEAKTLFLATASHELKTPLTVILGFADALATNPDLDKETQRQALEAVHRRAIELSKIVDRLLLSSRIESGRVDVVTGPVDITDLIGERVDAMRAATGRKCVVEVDAPVPLAMADPQAVVTIVDHLLDNAIKYSPGGGVVHVSVGATDAAVWLAVADEGVGMEAEQAARCFDKFWQAEASDVRRFGGTGIGLYIVKSLVEAMGGRIEVASKPGEGTTFTISLQRAGAPALTDAGQGGPGERGVGERSSIKEFMRQIGVRERSEV